MYLDCDLHWTSDPDTSRPPEGFAVNWAAMCFVSTLFCLRGLSNASDSTGSTRLPLDESPYNNTGRRNTGEPDNLLLIGDKPVKCIQRWKRSPTNPKQEEFDLCF